MARPVRNVPWLEKRENGVFYVNWYDAVTQRTERRSLKTRDPDLAAQEYGKFLLGGAPEPRRPAGLTVRQALADYRDEHVDAEDDRGRPRVADRERQYTIIAHLSAWFVNDKMIDVGPQESRGYVTARREGVVGGGKRRVNRAGSDSTIRRELTVLVAAFNHAVKWGRLPPDVRCRVELPSEHHGDGVKWLTKAQLELGINEAEGALRDFILLAYYTAGRRRSIENLTKFQVDLAGGRINLMPPEARRTKKRKPIVPIYPEIRPTVERMLAATTTEWLFGERRSFYRDFVQHMAALGIEAHPHMLRHSRASHMLMDGDDIWKVAKLLGDTVATVERVYGHVSPEFLLTESGVAVNAGGTPAEDDLDDLLD